MNRLHLPFQCVGLLALLVLPLSTCLYAPESDVKRRAMLVSASCRYALRAATEQYLEHLRYAYKELPALTGIFPTNVDDADAIRDFHAELCRTMAENGNVLAGIKVLPATHDAVLRLQGTHPICAPLFSNMVYKNGAVLDLHRTPLQYVEAGFCFVLADAAPAKLITDAQTTPQKLLPYCRGFCATLEGVGTRFPFYAPSLGALACDLAGCVAVVCGEENALPRATDKLSLKQHHFVLTLDEEPVQIGCCGHGMDNPLTAVALALAYAASIDQPLQAGQYVLCSGACPRQAARAGLYHADWGLFPGVACQLRVAQGR